jgi:hypothetical protein
LTIQEVFIMPEVDIKTIMQRLDELEKEVRHSGDIEQIKQLFIRYINAKNEGKPEDELTCLAKDAVVIGGAPPPSRNGKLQPPPPGGCSANKTSAFIVHPLITIHGDAASGKWVHFVLHAHIHTFQSLYWVQSEYDVGYTREHGEWNISRVRWSPKMGPAVPQHNQPASDQQ